MIEEYYTAVWARDKKNNHEIRLNQTRYIYLDQMNDLTVRNMKKVLTGG